MKKKPDEAFVKELQIIKQKLPKRYNAILEYKGFPYTKSKVYNVVHHGVENWEILKALKSIIK
jgi:hypothetical protein